MTPHISLSEGFTESMLYDYADSARLPFVRPLGRVVFTARKAKIGLESTRRARREADIFGKEIFSIPGIADGEKNVEAFFRSRRDTYFQEGVTRLVDTTLSQRLGSDRFLGHLATLTDD